MIVLFEKRGLHTQPMEHAKNRVIGHFMHGLIAVNLQIMWGADDGNLWHLLCKVSTSTPH
jgi:hypothetical protein